MNVYWSYPQSYPQNLWIINILHTKEDNINQTESRFDKKSLTSDKENMISIDADN